MAPRHSSLTQSRDALFNVPIIRLGTRLALVTERQVLSPHGLKIMEWRVLYSLARAGDHHLRALARTVYTDASHTSRVVAGMEKKGWVERYPDPVDKRRTQFSLTRSGRCLYALIWPETQKVSEQFKGLFSAEQLEVLDIVLKRATEEANAILDWPEPETGR